MDDQRFDNLTRLLGSGLNRRKVLRGLLGGAGALAGLAAVRPEGVGAQQCRAPGEVCQDNPGAGNKCCTGLTCSDINPTTGNGTCSGCPEGQYFCAATETCIANGTCCTDDDCGTCQECEGGQCVDLNDCCTADEDCPMCESCVGNTCTPYAEYCEATDSCYTPMTGGCCPNTEDGCDGCFECVGNTCTHIEDCCEVDADCTEPCHYCLSGTCTPFAEYCPEGDYCYNTMIGECCTDQDCGAETCVDGHCCPPGDEYCPDGDYCYTPRTGGCCTDEECGDEYCVEGECQPCRNDSDCPACDFCSEGTCVENLCPIGEVCCVDECVPIDECCKGPGDFCGLLEVTPAYGVQLDCCDGLVCCENLNSQGPVCAECCDDWDCPKGAFCHEGWCKFPEVECDHDKDCPKGTCCCKDGSCSGKCCHKPHPPKPPKPAPPAPVTVLPATGAGESNDSTGLFGAAALGAAAALYAAKKMRETPEGETEA